LLRLAYWKEGQRHSLALALSGTLLTCGISREDAARFLDALINATGDNEGEDRHKCLESTFGRLQAGHPIGGKVQLAGIVGEETAD